ncbi:CRISPR-associated helicase Cas3' [Thermococcus argininiproducens]|uniref:CRISPR-associated helicase Cas3 n=1 Tax=Thermococcus argininiproducens TaxID=2866384 RepID=A0A9E7MAR7_9EURY|nr:CRISPR-associated helicase Cas3' [Thermococcus argininiproducens]USH00005.1 CRISPR-associated helicase Cas3' [Thermococcus argininiproducens]
MINEKMLLNLGLDILSKTSHKNEQQEKSLKQHIEEIIRVSKILAQKHRLQDHEKILKTLAWWHDLGKLNPRWDITKKKKPPHSALSAYLFLRYSNIKDPKIFYFILRHHSHLTPILSHPNYLAKNVLGRIQFPIDYNSVFRLIYQETKQLNEFIERNKRENVIYVDLFGIFKTTDIVSAMFESENEIIKEKPSFRETDIKQGLQRYVKDKGLQFNEKKWELFLNMANSGEHILFSAPTGWGKTFASLTIASTKTPTHIIYVLPTITSIRKMKETIKKILKMKVEDNYYFADVEKVTKQKDYERSVDWELFISRSFMSPVTLTTLDQIILTFLHVGKYFLKRFHFRNSIFIFDEFHLYPISGLYILLNFIQKYNQEFNYNIKTVFMSATVHPALENLVSFYISPTSFDFTEEYKRRRRYIYSISEEDITDPTTLEKIAERTQDGNVLVVCNTVEKAIKIYLLLKHHYKIREILILHSRFTYKDRKEKEIQLEKFSRMSKGFVFVSTQVAEVSLDMSFDYLFTELAPLSSLIQRFGRVNRYSTFTNNENVKILKPSELDDRRRYPYNLDELSLAKTILEEFDGNIKTEFELIEQFKESSLKLDKTKLKEIDKYIQKWDNDTRYFFSIDLNDKELDKILNFRETNTILVIPECFIDKIADILASSSKYRLQKIKEYLTPIPIWWLFSEDSFPSTYHNFPTLSSSRFLYSNEVGYFDSKRLSEFIDEINVCEKEEIV